MALGSGNLFFIRKRKSDIVTIAVWTIPKVRQRVKAVVTKKYYRFLDTSSLHDFYLEILTFGFLATTIAGTAPLHPSPAFLHVKIRIQLQNSFAHSHKRPQIPIFSLVRIDNSTLADFSCLIFRNLIQSTETYLFQIVFNPLARDAKHSLYLALRKYNALLVLVSLISVASLLLHFVYLNSVIDSDEIFYKAAALTIINHTSCGPLANLASLQPCNLEHPPLAKLLMAASMAVFGTGDIGVRLPSIISGVLTVPATSWLVWSLSNGNTKATISAAVLISTSPTWFLLSSVGMLDSIEIFFGVLAFAIYFSHGGNEKTKLVLSGMVMGFSILSKETGILFLIGLMIYELFFGKRKQVSYFLLSALITVFLVLWIYDFFYTPFSNPFQHILFIVDTGLRLRYQGGFLTSPVQWFFQSREILLALLSLVWVPLAAIMMSKGRKVASGLSSFSVILLVTTLVPQIILYYVDYRQEYLFYELQVIPALVLGSSGLLSIRRVPWIVVIIVLITSILLFAYNLPSIHSVYF